MEDLPVPLSRVELYLAKACGMDVTVPEAPESRLEQYLAILAGDTSVEMPAPMSLTEQWLAYVLGVTPDPLLAVEGACYIDNQKVDVRYFAVAAGMPGAVLPPAPQNRKEQYWANIQGGGGGVLKYATGTNIALTDVVRGITSLENVYGNTTQDGTPTPDAPVAVNVVTGEQMVTTLGKNIANPDISVTAGSSNTSLTTIENGIKATYSGTATTSGARFRRYVVCPATKYVGETLTMRCVFSVYNGSTGGGYSFGYCDADGNNATRLTDSAMTASNTATSASIPEAANGKYIYITFYATDINGAAGSYAEYSNIQLESGSTATTYQPYQWQNYKINLPMLGKNKYSEILEQGAISTSTGHNETTAAANRCRTVGYNVIKPLTEYTLSALGTNLQSVILFYDKNYTFLSYTNYTNIPKTFTTPSGANYIRFNCRHSDNASISPSDITQIQLEEGSSATTYESPNPLELCKIGDYQDYIYKSGDDWYVHKETGGVTYDGSENWAASNLGRMQARKPNSNWASWGNDQSTYASKGFSNYVKAGNTGNSGLDNIFNVGTINIFVKATSAGTNVDANTWKTWLNAHNLVCYSILATPTDTQITDATLISQLNAVGSAVLPKPNAYIEVSADSTNLPGSLKISYYGEEE